MRRRIAARAARAGRHTPGLALAVVAVIGARAIRGGRAILIDIVVSTARETAVLAVAARFAIPTDGAAFVAAGTWALREAKLRVFVAM